MNQKWVWSAGGIIKTRQREKTNYLQKGQSQGHFTTNPTLIGLGPIPDLKVDSHIEYVYLYTCNRTHSYTL